MSPLPQPLIDRLHTIVNPINGLLGGVQTLITPDETNPWYIEVTSVGRPSQFSPDLHEHPFEPANMSGAGGAMDQSQAQGFAMIEGVERYACCVFDPADVQVLTWTEAMKRGAFSLEELPRLSAAEAAHPKCPIELPDPNAVQRWVRAENYLTGEPSLIPLVMSHLHTNRRFAGENFWLPISTGVAAHSTVDAAICSGLVENIERDAISQVWVHKLPLSPIDTSDNSEVQRVIDMAANAGRTIRLYDAKLDHRVPIVYAIDTSSNSPMRNVVSCAADYSYQSAALKALREATSCRIALEHTKPVAPDASVDDFIDVFDGALFMGLAENEAGFDFIKKSGKAPVKVDWDASAGDAGAELARQLCEDVESQTGSGVYTTSLTTSECRELGLEVWRVVAPGLQPLSFSHRAQWRAHPRLQSGPIAAGFTPLPEEAQNDYPQPFA